MEIRSVGMAAPFRWMMRALDVGARRPAALFGALGLLLAVVVALTAVQMAVQAAFQPTGTGLGLMYGLSTLVSTLLLPPLFAGVFRVLQASQRGAPVGAGDVFALYATPGGWRRTVGVAAAYTLVYGAFLGLLVLTPVGQFYRDYFAIAMAVPPGGEPDTAAILALFKQAPSGLFLWTMLIGMALVTWSHAYMFSLAHAGLRGDGAVAAIALGALGTLRNLLPLLGFSLALGLVGLVATLLVAVVLALVLGLLAALSPVLAMLVGLPLMLVLMLAVYALMFAFYYHGWRELSGDPDVGGPPAPEALIAA